MSIFTAACRSALLIAVFFVTVSVSGDEKPKKPTSTAAKRYESPSAVFDAFREADQKNDVRNTFRLLTSQGQVESVYMVCLAVTELASKEREAILSKYVDEGAAERDYEKWYKDEHGVDLKKFRAEHEHEKAPVHAPTRDDQLWWYAVASHVKDKPEFAEDVSKLLEEKKKLGPILPYGPLEDVVINGDKARGRAARLSYHYEPVPGKTPKRVEDKIYAKFRFRRVDGGWLLNSQGFVD